MYSVGSVANLISGSDTPKGKKVKKEHITPKKDTMKSPKPPNTPNQAIQSPNQRFQGQNAQQKGPKQYGQFNNRPFNPNQQEGAQFNRNPQRGGRGGGRPFNRNPQRGGRGGRPFNRNSQEGGRPFNPQRGGRGGRPFNQQRGGRGGRPFNRNPQQGGRPFNRNPQENVEIKTEKPEKNKKRKASNTEKTVGEKKAKIECPEKERRTIFVGNIPLDTTEKEIKQLFSTYGKVESMRFRGIPRADIRQSKKVALIKKNFHANRTSMIAYVVFSQYEEADKAKECNGQMFKGHYLRVNLATDTKPSREGNSIFVGNLPLNAEDNDLVELFKVCGDISSVRISRDITTAIGRGFGFVNFKNPDGVELAMQMENVQLKGRDLRIKRSNANKVEQDSKEWTSVKIDNVPKKTTRHYIIESLKKCGKIINITFKPNPLKKDFKTAIVAFKTAKQANNAMRLRFSVNNQNLFMIKDPFDPYKHVFLRNVPTDIAQKSVKRAFKDTCGEIKRCKLLLKPKPPHTTGLGILEFDTVEAAEKAVSLKTIKIKDQVVNIENYIKEVKKERNAESDNDEDDDDDDDSENQQNGEENDSDADDDESSDEEMEQGGDGDDDDDDNDDDDEDDSEEGSSSETEQQQDDDESNDEDDDDKEDDDDGEEEDDDDDDDSDDE